MCNTAYGFQHLKCRQQSWEAGRQFVCTRPASRLIKRQQNIESAVSTRVFELSSIIALCPDS